MYIEMTMEEAAKHLKKDATVFVAVSDLENPNHCDSFEKRKFGECKNIIEEAETIAKLCDELTCQLRCYSVKQPDIINYIPKGKMSTILFREQDRK